MDVDVPATASATDVITFTVLGGDPWLGFPVATLEQDSGSGFTPVLRGDGTPVTSEGYEFWLDLVPEPAYADQMPSAVRTFAWTFSFPASHRASWTLPQLDGDLRFSVNTPTVDGDVEVSTGVFTIGN